MRFGCKSFALGMGRVAGAFASARRRGVSGDIFAVQKARRPSPEHADPSGGTHGGQIAGTHTVEWGGRLSPVGVRWGSAQRGKMIH